MQAEGTSYLQGADGAAAAEGQRDFRPLADVLKALSDETRLQMMTLLLDREELCVCDFVEALGLTQSKASRHLRYLYHAGLVEDRREGLWIHYRISPRLTAEAAMLVEALSEAVGPARKEALQARLEAWIALKEERGTCAAGPEGFAGGSTSRCC